jgi:hypothetical protein
MHNKSPTNIIPTALDVFKNRGGDVSRRGQFVPTAHHSARVDSQPTLSSLLWEGEEAGYIQDPVQAI